MFAASSLRDHSARLLNIFKDWNWVKQDTHQAGLCLSSSYELAIRNLIHNDAELT
jgi:hypothetical protein